MKIILILMFLCIFAIGCSNETSNNKKNTQEIKINHDFNGLHRDVQINHDPNQLDIRIGKEGNNNRQLDIRIDR